MPDISMCQDNECPKKDTCFRFMAKPSHYQSYIDFKRDGDKCDDYMDMSKGENRRAVKKTRKTNKRIKEDAF